MSEFSGAAQSREEQRDFIESLAKVRLLEIISGLRPEREIARTEEAARVVRPDWGDASKLARSGVKLQNVDEACRSGSKYLHIDVAAQSVPARRAFLGISGLSDKQRRDLFPVLSGSQLVDPDQLADEVSRLNRLLDWLRANGADQDLFPTYHRSLTVHGRTQNTSGQVGAMGAAIAFIDAINTLDPSAIIDVVGKPPSPPDGGLPPDPEAVFRWMRENPGSVVSTLLLGNGRALVFSSSKDATIFTNLGPVFATAEDAHRAYARVRNNQAARHQRLHEFAVGEVKTATDPANLHERMGLASRETQTELRTDRFLMMALLTPEILSGGVARRTMNNRDLTRFSHVFNLHHCWGYDGGRKRNAEHWGYFVDQVKVWCGL